MSSGKALPLEEASKVATDLVALLAPGCERIEVAGSIRRRKPWVGDIEIVAIPAIETRAGDDLWSTPIDIDLLDEQLALAGATAGLRKREVPVHRQDGSEEVQVRDGRSYKALTYQDMPVDLFIVRPGETDWGVIFALRTGPGDWNTRIVTDAHRFLRRVEKGRVYRAGRYTPCPEERDFFEAIGQPWVEPQDRAVAKVALA